MRSKLSSDLISKYTAGGEPSKICQLNSMVALAGSVGGMAPFPGGALLASRLKNAVTGEEELSIMGAVGVSGATGQQDEYCALEGLKLFENADSSE